LKPPEIRVLTGFSQVYPGRVVFPLRCVIAAALCTVLATAGGCKKTRDQRDQQEAAEPVPDPRLAPYEQRARALIDELSAHGVRIDARKLRYELVTPDAAVDDFRAFQTEIFGPTYWEAVWCLNRALGLPAGDSPEQMAEIGLRRGREQLAAYYQKDRSAIVFMDTRASRSMDQDHLVAHELGHVYHDQQPGGLATYLDRPSLDQTRAAHSLLEGAAELIALSLLHARRGTSLMSVSVDDLYADQDRLSLGEHAAAIYGFGAQFMLRRYHVGDWKPSDPHPGPPPPSTEQLLHPEKLGSDHPTRVLLPAWPSDAGNVRLAATESLGELSIMLTLLDLGLPRRDARLIAAGWDGDQMAAYRTADGDCAVMWRSTWDRPEDAEQFARAVDLRGALVHQLEWVVDVVWAPDREMWRTLALALLKAPPPPPSPATDARTTALVEKQIASERGGEIADGRWSHAELGVSFPVADDFSVTPPGSLPGAGRMVGDHVDLALVVRLPDPLGDGLAAAVEAEQKRLLVEGGRAVSPLVVTEEGGARLAHAEYQVPDGDSGQRIVIHASDRGGQLRAILVLIDGDRWSAAEKDVRALIAGARFD
jgi:hypothetical protein